MDSTKKQIKVLVNIEEFILTCGRRPDPKFDFLGYRRQFVEKLANQLYWLMNTDLPDPVKEYIVTSDVLKNLFPKI